MDRLMSAIEEIHLIELEQGWDDELKCQSKHLDPMNAVCTEAVTHRIFSCVVDGWLVCQACADFYAASLVRNWKCLSCGVRVADHWRVFPA